MLTPRSAGPGPRPLVLLGKRPGPREDSGAAARGDAPRPEYVEVARAVDAEIIAFDGPSPGTHPLLRRLFEKDPLLGSSFIALRRRSEFGAIYLTGEDMGLRVAPLLRMGRWDGRVVMVVHACISAKRKLAMRALGHAIFERLVCVCEEQRRILVEEVGFPPDKVSFIHNWVDTDFFSPSAVDGAPERDYAFSCGLENRDYATLRAAAATLPFAFEISAAGFRGQVGPDAGFAAPNVKVHDTKVPYTELRRLYGQARLVVAPLNAVPYAAGVTGVLEAMAMGKAVVASASPGIRDYVEHGVSGLVVPPGDPEALARAVRELWEAPDRCAEMGRRNRAWVQKNAAVERYATRVAELMTRRQGGAPAP